MTFPLDLPSSRIRDCDLTMQSAVSVGESPHTFASQTQVLPGQRWGLTLSLPPLTRREAHAWLAFLAELNGREGTFLANDPRHKNPLGSGLGAPEVDGGAQAAMSRSLATRGWTPNAAGVLLKGDFLQVGTGAAARLHMVTTADVDADAAGKATINIWPGLRETPADGTDIVVTNARGVFRLKSNVQTSSRKLVTYGLSLDAWEAL